MKAKQTSDSPTALARHYKGVVAEQSAEIERLTPTELRRLQRRRDRYAVRLACRKLKLGRGTEGQE